MKTNLKEYLSAIPQKLLDKTEYKKIICFGTYFIMGLVSLFMTILNIKTHKDYLIYATAIFSLACIINIVCVFLGGKFLSISSATFSVEILGLFTFFLISGNPDGFSAIWICLLPYAGMLFYGKNKGSILCGVMFCILAFLLWFPAGQRLLQYDYNETFRMRFPILYFAFSLLAYFLEALRAFSLGELEKLNDLHKEISIRDQLTGLYNRNGLFEMLETNEKSMTFRKIGAIIFDIDDFKQVNDTHGHSIGDNILHDFAKELENTFKAIICRWGGEEFLMIYFDNDVKSSDLENFREHISKTDFVYDDIKINITVSTGAYETSNHDFKQFNDWVKKADTALYNAKESGKNKVVYF